MSTFADDIEEAAKGEPIEAIEVGMSRSGGWSTEEWASAPETDFPRPNEILSWAWARPLLDYEYDDGFGGQECHDIHAWTPTRVLFVWEYDGATHIASVPRHPVSSQEQEGTE